MAIGRLKLSRRALLLPLSLLALGALGASAGAVTAKPLPQCSPGQLSGQRLDSTGAAGTIMVSLVFRNRGSSTCTLRGFPSLQMLAGSRRLATHVRHGGLAVLNRRPRTVTLRSKARASLLVAYSDVPVGGQRSCPRSDALLVRPAAASSSIRVSVPLEACGGGRLSESPFLAGVVHAP
ncbi:MAG: DUF4232 domain-containing protein [Gaiellaceae bacterium]